MDIAKVIANIKQALPEGVDSAVLGQLDTLEQTVKPYEGLDPQAARDAIAAMQTRAANDQQIQSVTAQRDEALATAQTAQDQALTAQKELHAVRGLVGAQVRPEYESLLLPTVLTALEVGQDGAIAPKEGLWEDLKVKYPAMFYAEDGGGTGTDTGEGSTGTKGTPVPVTNGIISGVDPGAVLTGGVLVQ